MCSEPNNPSDLEWEDVQDPYTKKYCTQAEFEKDECICRDPSRTPMQVTYFWLLFTRWKQKNGPLLEQLAKQLTFNLICQKFQNWLGKQSKKGAYILVKGAIFLFTPFISYLLIISSPFSTFS